MNFAPITCQNLERYACCSTFLFIFGSMFSLVTSQFKSSGQLRTCLCYQWPIFVNVSWIASVENADVFFSHKLVLISWMDPIHLQLSETSGTSLGYGFSRIMMKSKNQPTEGQANLGIDGGVNDWRPEGSVLSWGNCSRFGVWTISLNLFWFGCICVLAESHL